jgi:Na+/proline symporter
MLASKSERDALGAVLFFNIAHYVMRPWPWILVGLASIIVYPQLSDIQAAFPNLDPRLLGHDIAYPAMLKFLPAGFIGLMVGGLIAANSSTILTHLNWGASYLVHDFYRRFVKTDGTERHYVRAGRLVTILLFICSSATVYLLDTAKDAFDVILQIGAGTGLLYLVRWFWWRVNAWCEIVAMISSFGFSALLLVLAKNGVSFSTAAALLMTVAVTTVCWLITAYVSPPTERDVLIRFYTLVRPAGPGWARVRRDAGLPADSRTSPDNIPMALLGWVAGCAAIWSALFAVGNLLYYRFASFTICTVVFVISGIVLIKVVQALWSDSGADATATTRA